MHPWLFVFLFLVSVAAILIIYGLIYTAITGKPFITFSSGQSSVSKPIDDVATDQALEKARETAALASDHSVFDFELGKLEKLWHPVSYNEYTRKVPSAGCLYVSLAMACLLGSFIASILIVTSVFNRPAPLLADPIWWVTVVVLIVVTLGILMKANSVRHARIKLSVYEKGVRFGKSSLRFEDIVAVSVGGFRTFQERNFPILERIREIRYPAYKTAKDKLRAITLDIRRKDGKTVHWFGLMGMFHPIEIAALLEILMEHVPQEGELSNPDLFPGKGSVQD